MMVNSIYFEISNLNGTVVQRVKKIRDEYNKADK